MEIETSEKTLRLLVVDDDALMRRVYQSAFRKQGGRFGCFFCGSGEDALAYLKGNMVDGIILDWDLPGIKGLEVLKALRSGSETATLPVFVITGSVNPETEAQAMAAGANDYASKLTPMKDLVARVSRLIKPRTAAL